MDDINGTTADCSGVAERRYSLRLEKNKFLGNDNNHEESTIDHDNDSSDNSDEPPLSEYELLRLRKIKRNEARLAQLGLLVPSTSAPLAKRSKSSSTDDAGGKTSALTALLLASPTQTRNTTKKKRKKEDITKPLQRRILPKRHCTTSRCSNGYSSDEESSVAASPILPKRILTLQPHQAAALDNETVLQCPRRARRGRPRREDYFYEVDEVCVHCGGEWNLDGDEDTEEETRLIRCKGCRGAFHLDCMMLHGKSEVIEDEASGSCKENKSALEEKTLQEGVPKRCFRCECHKSKLVKRKAFAPTLEAIVGMKNITVRLSPALPLEAVVRGANVMCYVSLKSS